MSIKNTLSAAVAAVTLMGGLGAAAAPAASAATPACGNTCINLYAQLYGPGHVLAVLGQQQNVGQPLVLAPASNTNPGEDFTVNFQGLISSFIAAGLVSPGLSPYGNDPAFEFLYTPGGYATGLCMGVATAPANHTPVALQPCGVSAKTVWFSDSFPRVMPFSLYNAATDTSFANPYALTDLKPGGHRQLFTWPFEGGGILHNKFSNQLWDAEFGVLGAG